MNRTPVYEAHRAQKAKLVDFAGWEMPIQYSGVIDEYHAVRSRAGLFDVSHMGRITVEGVAALPFLQRVTTNDVAKVDVLHSQYSMVCNPNGGVKDDIFLYRLGSQKFLLCVNASNREKIVTWLQQQQEEGKDELELCDSSTDMAQFALQGPASKAILSELVGPTIESLKPRGCLDAKLSGIPTLVTRTGYTGELGYELYMTSEHALQVWNRLGESGAACGMEPVGLGARDLLRLEMGYFLYGNELNEETTPLEAGAGWVVSFQKGPFVGQPVLSSQKEKGVTRRLVAFELLEKAVPRHGMKLVVDDKEVGEVTSGNLSPILQKGIGMGYVQASCADVDSSIQVNLRGRAIPARIVKAPFYKKPKPRLEGESAGGSTS